MKARTKCCACGMITVVKRDGPTMSMMHCTNCGATSVPKTASDWLGMSQEATQMKVYRKAAR